MRMTPRVILILTQASSAARLHKTLAQKLVMTHMANGSSIYQFYYNKPKTAKSKFPAMLKILNGALVF